MLNRKIVQALCYYVLPLAMLVATFTKAPLIFFLLLGELAIHWLVLTLFLKPLSIIFQANIWKILLSYRREFGVLIFWMVVFHGTQMWFRAGYEPTDFFRVLPLFFGLLAGVGIFLLGLTSNRIASRLLKGHWKTVHMMVYPVLFFGLLHAAYITNRFEEFIIISLVYVGLKLWAYIVRKNKTNSLGHKNVPSSSDP